ncbi:Two-component response regulator ORR41 [Hondaea fermentalgiana]|uniref:histidine kinase n=1 Tax=Hondaea fermentalgiana TaxID=2315210 RepID=A0A2R5G6W4_9STRA|nr:Two-component response regulator ORR41 [Hondaea fermentalgiana]|eukprot:GBG26730.1 Two-component response regulator ORR41 [Hondaea fermentalgiana]
METPATLDAATAADLDANVDTASDRVETLAHETRMLPEVADGMERDKTAAPEAAEDLPELPVTAETVRKLQEQNRALVAEAKRLRAHRNAMATALNGARVPICRHKGDKRKTLEWGNNVFWEKVNKRNLTEKVKVGASLIDAGWPVIGGKDSFSWYEIGPDGGEVKLGSLMEDEDYFDEVGTSSLDAQTGVRDEADSQTGEPETNEDTAHTQTASGKLAQTFAVGFWTPSLETTGSLTRAALLDLLAGSTLPAVVAYLDRDGIYRFANSSYLEFVQQPRVLGLHYKDVLPGAVVKIIEPRLTRALAGEALSHQSTVPRPDGKRDENGEVIYQNYEVRTVPDFRNGGVQGCLIVALDVTERAKQEKALLKAKHEAEAASKAKSEFLSVITHEIRTPLVAVLGFAELLEKTTLAKAQRDMLKQIESSGELLLQLLNDILDMAKIEAGKLELEQGEVKLFTLLKTVHDITSGPAQRKQLEWNLEIGDCVPAELIGDQARFSQILLNLLGNAVKFTPRGGRVTLRAAGIAQSAALPYSDLRSPSSSRSNSTCSMNSGVRDIGVNRAKRHRASSTAGAIDTLVLEVQDSGIGIAQEKLDTVFEAFTQAESSTTRKYGGTGLGLQLCKRLAALLGGDLSVHSELNVGSVFRVTVPIRVERDTEFLPSGLVTQEYLTQGAASETMNEQFGALLDQSDAASAAPTPMDLNVLLVEDTPVNQVIMRRFLEAAAVVVDTADHGEEALHKFKATCEGVGRPYDLIFMDIQMPVMDGFDATRNIRKIEQEAGLDPVPIVALTAFAVKSDLQRCLEAGCDRFLIKPVKRKDLLSAISQYSQGPGMGTLPSSSSGDSCSA